MFWGIPRLFDRDRPANSIPAQSRIQMRWAILPRWPIVLPVSWFLAIRAFRQDLLRLTIRRLLRASVWRIARTLRTDFWEKYLAATARPVFAQAGDFSITRWSS